MTGRNSNIIEDLEVLRILKSVITEICSCSMQTHHESSHLGECCQKHLRNLALDRRCYIGGAARKHDAEPSLDCFGNGELWREIAQSATEGEGKLHRWVRKMRRKSKRKSFNRKLRGKGKRSRRRSTHSRSNKSKLFPTPSRCLKTIHLVGIAPMQILRQLKRRKITKTLTPRPLCFRRTSRALRRKGCNWARRRKLTCLMSDNINLVIEGTCWSENVPWRGSWALALERGWVCVLNFWEFLWLIQWSTSEW